ncbi:hypothetical protein WJX74_007622 [Apatococcus lobatus]|uniref:Uncharacterized protein n=1 Tax=Apatococcus lobatus TaxID=904363 RepID=A0AAW1R3T5_9CHLO
MTVQPDLNEITRAGLIVYWVTFGIMIGSAVCFAVMTWLRPYHDRKHGYMILAVVLIASGAYYAMAAQGGSVNIGRPGSHVFGNTAISSDGAQTTAGTTTRYRSIYYARYIDWVFTTPLLLLDLMIMAAVPVAVATWVVVADIFMIVIGLFAALSSHNPRWGFYGASCFFEILIGYGLLVPGIKCAYARGKGIGTFYTGLALLLFITWWGYPIVWGFAEGANFISVDAEVAAYAGLDIVAKAVFGWSFALDTLSSAALRKLSAKRASTCHLLCQLPAMRLCTLSSLADHPSPMPMAMRPPTHGRLSCPLPGHQSLHPPPAPAPAPAARPNGTTRAAPTINPVATYDDTAVSNVASPGRLGHTDPSLPSLCTIRSKLLELCVWRSCD